MAKGNLKNIRVDQPRWNLALKVTARRSETISGILNAALDRYLKRHATPEEWAAATEDDQQPGTDTAA